MKNGTELKIGKVIHFSEGIKLNSVKINGQFIDIPDLTKDKFEFDGIKLTVYKEKNSNYKTKNFVYVLQL